MARKALVVKSQKKAKYKVRQKKRCQICGRSRSIYSHFMLCRLCLRMMILEGYIPGLKKKSV